MKKRTNEEYAIIDSIQVGSIEYVLGERPTHLDRYVVWECLNGSEYRQGDYTSSLGEAQSILVERATKELQRQRDAGTLPPASVQKLNFEWETQPQPYLRPMWPEEQKYAFSQSTQIAGQCGSIGYLRGDFDSSGGMFHTTWNEHRSSLVTPEFKAELDMVVNALRNGDFYPPLLKNRESMRAFINEYPEGKMAPNLADAHGYRVDTPNTAYLIRCKPMRGEYDFYLYAYKSEWLNQHMEKASFGIRFIDSLYNEKFRVKDGDMVRITYADGEQRTPICRYIDETHLEVENNLYHICELAEVLERNGSAVEPLESVP